MAYPNIFHLLLVFNAVASAQRIFIDTIPAYSELPVCAADQLETVVKNMARGCGDGSKTTSYSCFCTDSSSHFSEVISTRVASACLPETTTAVSAAADVFSSYCALGSNGTSVVAGSTTASAAHTQTAANHSSVTAAGTSASHESLPALPTETATSGIQKLHSRPGTYGAMVVTQLAALLLLRL